MGKYLLLFFILLGFFKPFLAKNGTNFGTYKIRVVSFNPCKGPKRTNCSDVSTAAIRNVNIKFDVLVKTDVYLTHGRVSAFSLAGKELYSYRMKKPCDHFFMRANLERFFNVTKDCMMPKNHYVFSLNTEEVSQKFYKENYIFGDLVFKSVFTGDNCNVICTIGHIKTTPI